MPSGSATEVYPHKKTPLIDINGVILENYLLLGKMWRQNCWHLSEKLTQ